MQTEVERRLIRSVEQYGRVGNHVSAAEIASMLTNSADPARTLRNIAETALEDLLDSAGQALPRPVSILTGLYAVVRLPEGAVIEADWLRAVGLEGGMVVDGQHMDVVSGLLAYASRPDHPQGCREEAIYGNLIQATETGGQAAVLAGLTWLRLRREGQGDVLIEWLQALVSAYLLTATAAMTAKTRA